MTDRSALKHSPPHPELLPGLRSAALSVESIASTPAVAALPAVRLMFRRSIGPRMRWRRAPMRAAQRRWRHCNYSHLPGIQLCLLRMLLLQEATYSYCDTTNREAEKPPTSWGLCSRRLRGRSTAHQTMHWSRPYPVEFLRLFLFRF